MWHEKQLVSWLNGQKKRARPAETLQKFKSSEVQCIRRFSNACSMLQSRTCVDYLCMCNTLAKNDIIETGCLTYTNYTCHALPLCWILSLSLWENVMKWSDTLYLFALYLQQLQLFHLHPQTWIIAEKKDCMIVSCCPGFKTVLCVLLDLNKKQPQLENMHYWLLLLSIVGYTLIYVLKRCMF